MAFGLVRSLARSARVVAPRTYQPLAFSLVRRTYATKKYTNDHEWITLEGDIGTMGVTNYAQKQLGEIVFVETSSEVDTIVKKEEAIGTIESVKAVSELFSPVSGTIVEVNTSLSDEPELINDDAEGEGWIYKIKLSNKSEFDGLLDKEPTDE